MVSEEKGCHQNKKIITVLLNVILVIVVAKAEKRPCRPVESNAPSLYIYMKAFIFSSFMVLHFLLPPEPTSPHRSMFTPQMARSPVHDSSQMRFLDQILEQWRAHCQSRKAVHGENTSPHIIQYHLFWSQIMGKLFHPYRINKTCWVGIQIYRVLFPHGNSRYAHRCIAASLPERALKLHSDLQ